MKAFSNVISNNNYKIKLVIADDGDTLFNATIFLGAGKFKLGGELGVCITSDARNDGW